LLIERKIVALVMTLILLGVIIVGQVYFYEDPEDEGEDTGGLTRYFDMRTKMGTDVAVTFYTDNEILAVVAMEAAYERVDEIEAIATRFDESSELMRLNANGSIENPSDELYEMFELAIEFGDLTNGAFDVTVKPLMDLWSQIWMLDEDQILENVTATLPLIGYQNITLGLENTISYGKVNMSSTLEGIAKGYAVDEALDVLAGMGVEHALVNAGGDIGTIGTKAGGNEWVVRLENPEDTSEYIVDITVDGKAVATSGNYRRFYDPEAKIGHILDPSTGYTANESMSVMIIADDCTTADILATGVFVMGPEDGMALINSLPDVDGLIIDMNSNITVSMNLSDYGYGGPT
jgi:thiamine biosynthesis lipoprotein